MWCFLIALSQYLISNLMEEEGNTRWQAAPRCQELYQQQLPIPQLTKQDTAGHGRKGEASAQWLSLVTLLIQPREVKMEVSFYLKAPGSRVD